MQTGNKPDSDWHQEACEYGSKCSYLLWIYLKLAVLQKKKCLARD